MDQRKLWTSRQDELRKLLAAKVHFEQGVQLFLEQHAAVHSAMVSGSSVWSLQDEVLAGLDEVQIKTCPRAGVNSIAWLLWHITRIEDLSIQFLMLGKRQVIDQGNWLERLGLTSRDVGASMDDTEVAALSAQIQPGALLEYRAAVGCATHAAVQALLPEQLKEIVADSAIQQLRDEGSISTKGSWLAEYYTGRTRGFFLTRTATSHNFIHLNEAGRIAARLRKKL